VSGRVRISVACFVFALLVPASASAWPHAAAPPTVAYSVGYESLRALRDAAGDEGAIVVHRIPALRVAEVRSTHARFASSLARHPGISFVQRLAPRREAAEPALAFASGTEVPWEWQYATTRADVVPESILRAAGAVTIAVVDTGADVSAPDLAAKRPVTFSTRGRTSDVRDTVGHGTFVAALAAGSVTNGDGIAGFGGDAKLMIVKAGTGDGSFTDVDEASAIAYAVDHGARIINLSLGGTSTSTVEASAVDYAAAHGVLVVAAAGNDFAGGNPTMYPAALVQPLGSNGLGGKGLAVGATDATGERAAFSSTGTYVSLAAPGDRVFSAVSSTSPEALFPRVALPGSLGGFYGYGSGTSFAAPQVAGAAALVMAANPRLDSEAVAGILKETASGRGDWSPELGYGVIDVAAAVERAGTVRAPAARSSLALDARVSGRQLGLTATLSSIVPAISLSSRRVSVDVRRSGSWTRVGTARTNATGKAVFRPKLTLVGRVQLRARWTGAGDLAPATSGPVTLTLPRRPVGG
jgi:subtilisin family serine protease